MKVTTLLLTFSLAAFAAPDSGDGSIPAPSNVRGGEYPKIQADQRVTFRLKAPTAQKVQVIPQSQGLGSSPYDMTRAEDGTWTVTTPPVRPGFFYYQMSVDGVPVNDPGSETYFGWAKQTSGLEVPDKTLDFYEFQPVPHGEVRILYYQAKTTGTVRRVYVYTPPHYDANRKTRYPVLYLQHGSGESERGWTTQGKANFILDNLIASGKARPMIIVMENGYATKAGAPAGANRGNEAFGEVVINDLIPMIDASFRTIPDRKHRAIAGLSMGAGQAMQVALANAPKFGYVGAFSGASRNLDVRAAAAAEFRLLWMGCGVEDRLYAGGKAIHESLEKAGVKHVWFEVPGEHEWQVWRKHLAEFAPLLFR